MSAKQKHMGIRELNSIQHGLDNGDSFKKISDTINKDCTTVSKCVRQNYTVKNTGAYGRPFNNCVHRFSCEATAICHTCSKKRGTYCKFCFNCRSTCSEYVEEKCPKLSKPPYVCNGCKKKSNCTLTKHIFDSCDANIMIRERKKEAHEGFNLTPDDIEHLDNIFKKGVKEKNQSIHHVYVNNEDTIMVSERTMYRIIDSNILEVRNIDLQNKVKLRPRKNNECTHKIDRKCREGRTYEDFLKFMEEHKDLHVVEMDSVIGKKNESETLLTLHFRDSSFMIAFFRKRNDAKSVKEIFDELYKKIGKEKFCEMFPVILTDNGPEFSNPVALEFDEEGNRRTYIFYCDAGKPYQKGSCEVNHELIRRIIPKGISFKELTQEIVNIMMSHINSYRRKKLNNRTPLQSFSFFFGNEVPKKLGIYEVDPKEVNLSPVLIK